MDWSNKEVINNPNLSYTSRDYASILRELKAAIPLLTKIYNPQNETDPGIVLIKEMAMLGDMLSYNLDNNALEVYPKTVIQPKNAQKIFRLVGYKMRWYLSARCKAQFTNSNSVPVSIGRYNTFTSYTGIVYTNLDQIEIHAGATGTSPAEAELVQGKPITPSINVEASISSNVGEWHDVYTYNVDVKDAVIDDRIYLPYENVDGTTITLIDNDETRFAQRTWTLVDNLNTLTDVGKYFEFDFDESGKPYIQLPDYWKSRYSITKFKLFYVISDGSAGEIIDNSLKTIGAEKLMVSGGTAGFSYLENIHIYNTASTYGYSPETPEEARKSAELYVNTLDTLVVLDDFTKATKRITGVANALATDKETDPDSENMVSDTVKLYIIRKPGYEQGWEQGQIEGNEYFYQEESAHDDIWKDSVKNELESYKLSRYDLQVFLENSIDWIEWTIEGSLWLRQPVPVDKNHEIMVKINDNLDYTFSPSNLDFNEAINYIDVIDNIKASDNLIYHVDLNTANIQYGRIRRDTNGNATGLTVQRKWRIYNQETGLYTYYYATGFGCEPTEGGNGSLSGAPGMIKREENANVLPIIEGLTDTYNITELEIVNNHIYYWNGNEQVDTGFFIDQTGEYSDEPRIMNKDGEPTGFFLQERLEMILSDGLPSGEYMVRAMRDYHLNPETGKYEGTARIDDENGSPVYDIYDDYEWTGRFILRDTGELFILRNTHVYSMHRFYKEGVGGNDGDIVDRFGNYVYDENGKVIIDPVAKEELTGRYEQTIARKFKKDETTGEEVPDLKYDFYLGQDADGNALLDSIGNEIEAFPIKPNGFHVYVDIDKFVLHDTGHGLITGTPNALTGYGSIDYATGRVTFELMSPPETDLKVVFYKNTVAMARYNTFDTDKFYTQPQFLRYSETTRTLS